MEKIDKYVWFQEGPGVRKNQYTDNGVKLLNVANLVDGKLDLSTSKRYISKEEANGKYKHFLADEGDLIIASSGIQVDYFDKKMGFVEKEHLPLCMNTSTIRFKVIDEKITNIKFFMYFLKSEIFKKQLQKLITGSAQLNFGPSHLKKITINMPKIQKQEECVKELDKVSGIIDIRNKQIKKLNELIKSQFVELFGDINNNTKNFNVVSLKECCKKITDGTHDTPKRYENGVLLITGKNIRENHFDLTNIEYVSEEDHKKIYARCNPEKGDILYTNIGVNYCTAMVNPFEYEFSMKNVALLKPNFSIIDSVYFSYALNYLKSKIVEKNKGAGAQTFIGLSAIAEIEIPIPDLQLQNVFEKFVKQIDKQKFEIQQSLNKMQELYESLMDKYFG